MGALRDLAAHTYAMFRPPAKQTVSEWADKHRVLVSESSAEPGRWRTDRAPYQREIMDSFTQPGIWQIVIMASAQVGKALDVDTPIPTLHGWKKMADVEPGDVVYDENGNPITVEAVSPVWDDRPCYELTFSDGAKIVADEEHLWTVDTDTDRKTISTKEIAGTYKNRKRNTYAIPVCGAIAGTHQDLLVPPYTLGFWLGDGNTFSAQATLSKDDVEIIDYIRAEGVEVNVREKDRNVFNLQFDRKRSVKETGICIRGHVLDEVGRTSKGLCAECARQNSKHFQYGFVMDPVLPQEPTMHTKLLRIGVLGNKHIPEIYQTADYDQRLELLRGIMDSDGYADKRGRCEITLKSERLIKDVQILLAGLGIKSSLHERKATCRYKGELRTSQAFRLSFMVYSDKQVFRLKRKAVRQVSRDEGFRRTTETERRRIVDVRRVSNRPTKCVMVSGESHLFLAGEAMIPTHNSEIELNMMGCAIDNDPGPMLYIQPTDKVAEDYSKRRVQPMINACPTLRTKVYKARSRDAMNTVTMKTFPGGSLAIIGANSPADLSSKPVRYIFMDETDRFPASAGTEGDPQELAERRTETFRDNRKIVKTSTPTIKGRSKIEADYMSGTQEEWHTQCPYCHEFSFIRFDNIRFEKEEHKTETGETDYVVNSVAWRCPVCQHDIPEHEAKRLPAKWVSKNPKALKNGIRSFRLNAFMSPWSDWKDICWKFLKAHKDPEKLKVFHNTVLGESWEVRIDNGIDEELYNRREYYEAEVPNGVLVLTMGVDTQDNRLEYEVVGWDRNGQSWGISRGVIPGRADAPGTWEEVDDLLDREWKTQKGIGLKILATFIDSGGHHTTSVYRECAKRQTKRIWPIKGEKGEGKPECYAMKRAGGMTEAPKFMLGVDAGKEGIMYEAGIKEPGPRYMHFPMDYRAGYNREFFKGLISERMEIHRRGGKAQVVWEQFYERNEPLDCRNYARAAYRFFNWHFDELERTVNGVTETKVITQAEDTKRKQRHVVSRGIRV